MDKKKILRKVRVCMQRRERCKDDVFDEAEPREDQLEKEERGEKTLFHI